MSSTVASTGSSQATKSMLQTLQLSECVRTKRCPVPYITSLPPAYGLRDGVLPHQPEQTCSWTESGLKSDSGDAFFSPSGHPARVCCRSLRGSPWGPPATRKGKEMKGTSARRNKRPTLMSPTCRLLRSSLLTHLLSPF